jgi:hypothetical protein
MAHKTPEYRKILDLLESTKVDSQVSHFLEVYLVLHDARPGAIISVLDDNAVKLLPLLLPYKVYLFRYSPNVYFVVKRKILTAGDRATFAKIAADPLGDHPLIGELLGYMTPMNIFAVRDTGLSARIMVRGITHNGDSFNSQVAPQVVMGKTEEMVRSHFAPLEAVLSALNTETSVVLIHDVSALIEPSQPLLKSLRKTRRRRAGKTRRLR